MLRFNSTLRTFAGAVALATSLTSLPVAAEESTGYLFDLKPETILVLMDGYRGAGNYDRAEVLEGLRLPFSCEHHRSLCEELGPEFTLRVLEHLWTGARDNRRPEILGEEVDLLIAELSEAYVDATYPEGLDPRDAYFGEVTYADDPTPAISCDHGEEVATEESSDGLYRVRVAARAYLGGPLSIQWANTTFQKKNGNGKFRRTPADFIDIEAHFFFNPSLAPEVTTRYKAHHNDRRVRVSRQGDGSSPHTEACGTVDGPRTLKACACTGERPLEYLNL